MTVAEFFARLATHAPGAPALHDAADQCIDYRAMQARVAAQSDELRAHGVQVLGTQLDNGIDWAVADLAALHAGVLHVPLPLFFTAAQAEHALRASGADSVLDRRADGALRLRRRTAAPGITPHDGTAKITFTSGTTGTPKGVCLSAESMLAVAQGLAEALAPCGIERHLCALPLAVLLENIAGLYAPLLAGATVVVPPLARRGPQRLVTLRPGAARCRGGALRRAQRHHAAADAARLDGVARCAGTAHVVAALRRRRRRRGRRGGPFAGARVRTSGLRRLRTVRRRFGADAQPAGRRLSGQHRPCAAARTRAHRG